VDATGSSYITGVTSSTDFPTSTGALQTAVGQAFVTKLNALGNSIAYSTYLGTATRAYGIAVDPAGEAYVTGGQASGDLPTTANGFQPSCGDSAFLTMINAQGNGVIYSTCFGSGLGGVYGSGAHGVAIDSTGKAYLVGWIQAGAVPTTPGAFQPAGAANGFVAVLDPSVSGAASLIYATYLGGNDLPNRSADVGSAIAVDAYGMIYVTGTTGSSNFPVTSGAFLTNFPPNGGACGLPQDYACHTAFVAKLNPRATGASSLIYSTFLGGNPGASGAGIAVDSSGSAYVTGLTGLWYTNDQIGTPFPTTPGAFKTSTYVGENLTFVTKINAAGNGLVYSTLLGGPQGPGANSYSQGTAIAIDQSGQACVVGNTQAGRFPTTPDAFQPSYPGATGGNGYNAFLTKLNATGSALIYSSYLGGSLNDDFAIGIALDRAGDAYVAGLTESADSPVTPGALRPALSGIADAFVSKFPLSTVQSLAISSVTPAFGGNVGTVHPRIIGSGFHNGAVVKLVGSATVSATSLDVGSNGRTIDLAFDLSSAPAGQYDLVVSNSDGSSVTLPRGFTVQQGGSSELSVSIVGRNSVAIGHGPSTFTVVVSNGGNTDAVGVVVSLYGIPSEASLTPLFTLSSLPTDLGGFNIDFSQTPFAPVLGQEQIPSLLLAMVPAGSSVTLPFALKLTSLPAPAPLQPPAPVGPSLVSFPASQSLQTPPATLSSVQVSAVVTELNNICTSSSTGSCLSSAVSAAASVLNLLPGVGQLTSLYSCVHDSICLRLMFILAKTPYVQGHPGVLNLNQVFAKFILDCIGVLPGLGSITNAIQAGAAIINAFLDCISTITGLAAAVATFLIHAAFDPNDKEGLVGVGTPHWTSGLQGLFYSIYFANEATASAAAQRVVVTDVLDPALDLSSLRLAGISIGGTTAQLSPPLEPDLGQNQAAATIDLRPNQSLLVDVNVTLNPSTGTLSWQVGSFDPTTGMPPTDPNIGALPVGMDGVVSFWALSHTSISTGTLIPNQATVVFDSNPSMTTPTWVNTIDNTPPISHVVALLSTEPPIGFVVNWAGSDVGAGVQDFTIYSSDNGGPFMVWQSNTTSTSAAFTGQLGHTYSFYSIARDLVGNVEPAKTVAEGTTTVAVPPPDYALSTTTSTLTLAAGQSGSTTITVTPQGYSGAVNFSCGTLPSYITCTISPSNSINVSGTTASTVQVNVQIAATVSKLGEGKSVLFAMALPLGLLGFLPMFGGKRKRRLRYLAVLMLVCGVSGVMLGCNSTSSNTGPKLPPAGMQTITLSSTGSGGISHQLTLQVIVTN
jgi:hypothetical protein